MSKIKNNSTGPLSRCRRLVPHLIMSFAPNVLNSLLVVISQGSLISPTISPRRVYRARFGHHIRLQKTSLLGSLIKWVYHDILSFFTETRGGSHVQNSQMTISPLSGHPNKRYRIQNMPPCKVLVPRVLLER